MKHLFIINPVVDKIRGRVSAVIEEINNFFADNAQLGFEYDIHVTRWARDAVGFIRRYAYRAEEIIRVHVFGGSGTLFEAVNGVVGLPNTQLAAYPMGRTNYFLRYFGDDKTHLFSSIRNQLFSGVMTVDVIRCGNIFGISHGLVGVEALSGWEGARLIERTRLPSDLCYMWSVMKNIAVKRDVSQHYRVELDGKKLDSEYISMMVANGPCYGRRMNPAPDAHPDDGVLDMYFIKNTSMLKNFGTALKYAKGQYHRLPDRITHLKGSKITISSDREMCISVDGEIFYENVIEYELVPYAVDFVCPAGIDLTKIPRVRGRPEEG